MCVCMCIHVCIYACISMPRREIGFEQTRDSWQQRQTDLVHVSCRKREKSRVELVLRLRLRLSLRLEIRSVFESISLMISGICFEVSRRHM